MCGVHHLPISRTACQPVVGDRRGKGQSLALHAFSNPAHLADRVQVPGVVPTREVGNIALQMLGAELVTGVLVRRSRTAQRDLMPLVRAMPRTYSPELRLTDS